MAKAKKKKKYRLKNKRAGDFWFLLLVMALTIFGICMVFSASYYYSISKYGYPYFFLIRNLMWAGLGVIAMAFFALMDYHVLQFFARPILAASFIMCCLIFTPIGIEINHARRWIGIEGFPVTLMPGEIAKIAVIIFVAAWFSEKPERARSFKEGVIPMLAICVVFGGLIIKQPNLSTAITLCGIVVIMLWVAGLPWIWTFGTIGFGVGAIGLLLMASPGSEWHNRITSFLDPFADPLGEGYQVVQSLLALGTGGIKGMGLGQSLQKTLYLPEPQNDFILAIIGEEIGYIGILFLMMAYLLLIYRGIHIALNAKDMMGSLLAGGITVMIALQVIMNVAIVTSSMPPTGVILPFVSYGGNALMIFLAAAGMVLNVSRQGNRDLEDELDEEE